MNAKLFAAAFAAILCVSAFGLVLTDDVSAASEPDAYYTYSPTFHSTATEAEDVRWDFGNGQVLDSRQNGTTEYAALLAAMGGNVWSPRPTYPDNGSLSYIDYVVTQTVYNSYEGGSEDSFSSTIRIMGHPTITFVTNGGSEIATVEVPKGSDYVPNTTTAPADPTYEGHEFEGWFSDPELTEAFDWSTPIAEDVTLYAAWSDVSGGPVEGEDTGKLEGLALILTIIIALLGIALIIAGIWKFKSVVMIAVGILLIIVCIPFGWYVDAFNALEVIWNWLTPSSIGGI